MYSLPSFTPHLLIEKYKRQTYLVVFPIGILLSILYILNFSSKGIEFFVALAILFELVLFMILILAGSAWKDSMEVFFYFSIPVYFFIMTQVHINLSISATGIEPTLGDPVYSLCMWLIVFLIGAFLSLKPAQIKAFILFIFSVMVTMAVLNLWRANALNELRFPVVYTWVNALIGLGVATLLVQRIGLLQKRNAATDALTGVLNRHALYPILAGEIDRAERYDRPLSIILLDIDQFKSINDRFGHLEGDKVLKELSALTVSMLRKTDHAGRWGGEEFLLILPETDLPDAGILTERIRSRIESTHFVKKYQITASFSLAAHKKGQSLESLLEIADHALYEAKNNGRNQVIVSPQ